MTPLRTHDCGAPCPLRDGPDEAAVPTDRRTFLRTGGACLGLATALLGLPTLAISGVQSGDERRYPIPTADSVSVDRSAQVIVTRFQGHVFVFALSCPHQNNAVKWVPQDQRFQCTKHDSQYRPDGTYTSGRSTRNLDRYLIRRDGDAIVVDLRRWVQADKDPVRWAAATILL